MLIKLIFFALIAILVLNVLRRGRK